MRLMDRSTGVWILGGYQSDFARNLTREGRDFAVLTAEVVDGTLAACGVDADHIDVVHVGNAFGEMFASQGHLGAMPATVCDGLWGTPATRHACASACACAHAEFGTSTAPPRRSLRAAAARPSTTSLQLPSWARPPAPPRVHTPSSSLFTVDYHKRLPASLRFHIMRGIPPFTPTPTRLASAACVSPT